MNSEKKDYSIVIPVYQGAETLVELCGRINQAMIKITDSFEIIFVNDKSPDNSWDVITQLSKNNPTVRGFNLNNNIGRHGALMIGFKHAIGKVIITMDDDLQHRPEDIPQLINKANKGFDVVFAEFKNKKHVRYKNLASWIKRRIEKYGYSISPNLHISGFLLLNRTVVDKTVKVKYANPYLPGLLFSLVLPEKITNASATHVARKHGKSSYNLWRSLKYFTKMIRFSTSRRFHFCLALTMTMGTGLFVGAMTFLFITLDLIKKPDALTYFFLYEGLIGGSIITLSIALQVYKHFSKHHRGWNRFIDEETANAG